MIRSIRLQNVRSHADITCHFKDKTTLIYGKNGSGKTSILEAIYLIYRGTSWRGNDREMLRHGSSWLRVDVEDEGRRTATYQLTAEEKIDKKFILNDKTSRRLPVSQTKPVILFTPDDLQLITGSPARRREYLDRSIAQFHPTYMRTLRQYTRALAQRNKLLKQSHCTLDQVFSWDVLLSKYGEMILTARYDMVAHIDRTITEFYQKISRQNDEVSVVYGSSTKSANQLLEAYRNSFAKDRLLGSTSVGPHRDDLFVTLNGSPAQNIASRGESRTIILALKQAEVALVTSRSDSDPIILLDDVFGELDESRQRYVKEILRDYQKVITHTTPLGGEDTTSLILLSD